MPTMSVAKRIAGLFVACAAMLGASPALAQTPPDVYFYFVPTSIAQGSTSNVTLYIYNFDASTLTGGAIAPGSFTYPAQVVNTGTLTSNNCGGSVTASSGASTLSASGVTLPASGNCVIEGRDDLIDPHVDRSLRRHQRQRQRAGLAA